MSGKSDALAVPVDVVLLRRSSRPTVERWHPMARAISDLFKPCLLRAASIYLSAWKSSRYVMAQTSSSWLKS